MDADTLSKQVEAQERVVEQCDREMRAAITAHADAVRELGRLCRLLNGMPPLVVTRFLDGTLQPVVKMPPQHADKIK